MTLPIDQLFDAPGEQERVAAVLAIVSERVPSLIDLRVLDLGCRTGAFTRGFAAAGATATGIEGRYENWSQIPDTPGATFIHQDVRQLNPTDHGHYDVTLCLGILYHLDAHDAVQLLKNMRQVTTKFAVIDTHISHVPEGESYVDYPMENGHWRFYGHWYDERPFADTWWASINAPRSWWFTPSSLRDACLVAGWETIDEIPGVRYEGEPADRHWLLVS